MSKTSYSPYRWFFPHIELWLSAVAILIILFLPPLLRQLLNQPDGALWEMRTVTAVAVGTLHGVLFWTVRRRQRVVRQRTVDEVQDMLNDLIDNKLSQIVMTLHTTKAITDGQQRAFASIKETALTIGRVLDTVSEESLEGWKSRYQRATGPLRTSEAES
jgi:hypothetical protein